MLSPGILEDSSKTHNTRKSRRAKQAMPKSLKYPTTPKSSHSNVFCYNKIELLYIFMHAHDPTTYHRQGIDSGSQYRSVVYYQTEDELRTTIAILK